MPRKLRIGTRGSRLALVQARWIAARLRQIAPGLEVEELVIRTKGDKITDVPLSKVGGKGLFIKEIEEALLEERIDLAVHSMKDMPAELPEGLVIGCVPEREDPCDALCTKGAVLEALPPNARVGTSSLRRQAQLKYNRPDLQVETLRGNVETRLSKMDEGRFDAVVLAAAGLKRLGLSERITERLSPQQLLPAVGQGALAVEVRAADEETTALLSKLEDPAARIAVTAERAFLSKMEGSCQVPIAAHAALSGERLVLDALVCDLSGERMIRRSGESGAREAARLGEQLAGEILSAGGREILDELFAASAD